MITLSVAALIAVSALNVSLVAFVADRLTPAAGAPVSAGAPIAVNENSPVRARAAA
ncbi:hypothetical protein [Methylobacterium planeticum]|uniref:hypothetical protein n=1 Tax=Methylobacterium planeticum TaxID=2615211 RepID=UPI00177E06A6|nr:hypothetical protein [Methylobacterium planeticum]